MAYFQVLCYFQGVYIFEFHRVHVILPCNWVVWINYHRIGAALSHSPKKETGYEAISRGTLPETNIAPKNGCLEYYFPIGDGLFSGAMLVSGRVVFLSNLLLRHYSSQERLRLPHHRCGSKPHLEVSIFFYNYGTLKCFCLVVFTQMGVSKNRGKTPQIHGILIGFVFHYFHLFSFWGGEKPRIFGFNTQIFIPPIYPFCQKSPPLE